MSEDSIRHCPGCGQALRFPAQVGGMLMACPVCGRRFVSPFRLAGTVPVRQAAPPPPVPPIRPAAPAPAPSATPEDKPQPKNIQAARIAALYASKS